MFLRNVFIKNVFTVVLGGMSLRLFFEVVCGGFFGDVFAVVLGKSRDGFKGGVFGVDIWAVFWRYVCGCLGLS